MKKILGRFAIFALLANEVRGIILAAPVMWALYQSGGAAMALWLAFCSIMGIALTVVVPVMLARKLKII